MKFADKYEILEMVTSGRVSTFLARERASQEAVVVYTFECGGTGAGELSTASIISRFCALAPNPPGIIVKAGFDDSSSSAFITTKMPEAVALKAWVGAYQSFAKPGVSPTGAGMPAAKQTSGPAGDETAELSATELRALLAKSGPSKPPPVETVSEDMGGVTAAFSLDTPAPAAPQPAGEFTRLFREANTFEPVQSKRPPAAPPVSKPSDATDAIFGELLGGSPLGGPKPATPPSPQKVTPVQAEPSPGSFTREFMGLAGEKPTPPAEPWASEPAKKEPGAFTREFMAVSQQDFQKSEPPARPTPPPARRVSSSPQATSFESIFGPSTPPAGSGEGQPENQKSGAGEFTSFFRDPFESPGAPEKPIVVPDVANSSPTKPPVGDFTRMFGRDEISGMQPAPLPPPEPEAPQASPGSFTQMFGQPPAGKKTQESQLGKSTLGTNPNVRPSFLEPSGAPAAPPEAPRRSTPVPTPPADSIFSRTPSMAPPVNQPFMSRPGSSEATDVFRIPGGDAPPVEPAPSGPSEFTVFLSRGQVNAAMAAPPPGGPAMPAPTFALPAAPPPPPFQFTPPPPPPPPAPPAMKMPVAPAPPAAPAVPAPVAPPKAAGFWPLIVVLTVLLAIGAMLVMYFALKH